MITVVRIDRSQTVNPHITRFLITLSDGRQFTTISRWRASLAQRYKERGTSVQALGIPTRFGMVLSHLQAVK